jgi:hypothetical protein
MSGAETSFTDLMSGETIGGDDPKGPCDAISSADHRNFAGCLLCSVVDGGFHDGEEDRDRAAKPIIKTETV